MCCVRWGWIDVLGVVCCCCFFFFFVGCQQRRKLRRQAMFAVQHVDATCCHRTGSMLSFAPRVGNIWFAHTRTHTQSARMEMSSTANNSLVLAYFCRHTCRHWLACSLTHAHATCAKRPATGSSYRVVCVLNNGY